MAEYQKHKSERFKSMIIRKEHDNLLSDLRPETKKLEQLLRSQSKSEDTNILKPRFIMPNYVLSNSVSTFYEDDTSQIKINNSNVPIPLLTLQNNIKDILVKYDSILNKYEHNELMFILYRYREQYEASDEEIKNKIDQYKKSIKEYKNKENNELKDWKLDNINQVLDNRHSTGQIKTCPLVDQESNDSCPSNMVYGHLDIPPGKTGGLTLDSNVFLPESFLEYFDKRLDEDDCKMYKWLHRRQYVIGNMEMDTGNYKLSNKYFRPFGGNLANYKHPYEEITWSLRFNSVFMTCMMRNIYQKNNMIFPLRLIHNDRFIGEKSETEIGNKLRVSRYAYMTEDDQHLIYLGMIRIPIYTYNSTENNDKISPPKYIGDMFRKDEKLIDNQKYLDLLNLYLKTKIKENRIKKELFHYDFHLFYNTKTKPNSYDQYLLFNYKANKIQSGHIFERFNVFHTELNQIFYIHKNRFNNDSQRLYPRLYRYDKSNIYFYSPLSNLKSIKDKYKELKDSLLKNSINLETIDQHITIIDSSTVDNFVSKLSTCELKRDKESGTYYIVKIIDSQSGGKNSNNIIYRNMKTVIKSKSTSSTNRKSLSKNKETQILQPKQGSYIPGLDNNIVIELDNNNTEFSWDIKKGLSERAFYNYPVNTIAECLIKYDELINLIIEKENIKTNKQTNIGSYPEKALSTYVKLKRKINTYSQLVDRVYASIKSNINDNSSSEIRRKVVTNNKSSETNFPDSYIKNDKAIYSNYTILYHRFIYHRITVHSHYLNKKYDLIPHKLSVNNKIFVLSPNMGYTEACIVNYMKTQKLNDVNSHIETCLLSYMYQNFDDTSVQSMNVVYKYDNIINQKKIWSDTELEKYSDALDLMSIIFVDANINTKQYEITRTNAAHMLLTGLIYLALNNLKLNGNMIITIPNLGSKYVQDMIYVVNSLFKKTILTMTPIQEPHINSIFIICFGYKERNDNISKQLLMIYKDMYKNDETGGLQYQTKDSLIVNTFDLPKSTQKIKYYNSLIKTDNEIMYRLFFDFSQQRLDTYDNYLNKLTYYYQNYKINSPKLERYKLINVGHSINMANYLGLKINPYLDVRNIQSDLINNIYRNLYGLDTTVYYIFRKYDHKIRVKENKLENSHQYLLEQILRMDNATKIFDTRKIENYNQLKKHLRFYERTLNETLMSKFNMGIPIKNGKITTHPSRAWIKMYEIAEITKLIPKKANKYKVFSFCEAPGNFILAINHFIKTRTQITNFDWVAQSYNPNSKKGRQFHVLGDDYDLMRKYPDKWDFGPKNTGDVTDPDNIKYYGSVYDDVDLLTSDCGTDWSGDDLISSKLMYGQLLFILNNLPSGKNFVIKYYIPFIHYPAQLALFYIIYQSFEEISFYKPLQNAWSHEFYLIGKKYKKLDYDKLKPLFDILDDYNPYRTPIPINTIPKPFMLQLETAVKDIVDRFVFYIERYIYYLDLMEEGKKPNFDVVKKHIHIRNEEWIKKFKIKKIDNKDKM
jgi:hypothetical protein